MKISNFYAKLIMLFATILTISKTSTNTTENQTLSSYYIDQNLIKVLSEKQDLSEISTPKMTSSTNGASADEDHYFGASSRRQAQFMDPKSFYSSSSSPHSSSFLLINNNDMFRNEHTQDKSFIHHESRKNFENHPDSRRFTIIDIENGPPQTHIPLKSKLSKIFVPIEFLLDDGAESKANMQKSPFYQAKLRKQQPQQAQRYHRRQAIWFKRSTKTSNY